ncbi:cytochrome d ubiquinol oxidase subunit II [Promicromonospora vindobonensis]|uniref:Cytochrome d ubiquinol oxidase subunit II n=1 Tax=Promicromonospora vindobonensis TaxID=195748 RepID=A0ABW5VQZ0_9MICO
MDLAIVWFVIIAILWTGYFVLEGFDFGVGMLMSLLPRGDAAHREKERRVLVNSIGPVWDGNEVWLITAAGATFAAFPEWYATLFSGFYLPLLAILVALIVRGVAFEYRGKISDAVWARRCDIAIQVGSWVPAILWGVMFANLVRGVQLDDGHQYVGGLAALLNPFALLGGLTTLVLFLLHGTVFVALKTDGPIRARARRFAGVLTLVALAVAGVWALWTQVMFSPAWTWVVVIAGALALVGVLRTNRAGREGYAFGLSAVTIVAAVVLIFGSMFPDVMPGLDGGSSLSIAEAASTPYTLTVLTWVAVALTPVVILYQGWTYWVFRRRLTVDHIPAPAGLTWKKIKDAAF